MLNYCKFVFVYLSQSKTLNSLTAIDMFSYIGSPEVTHQTVVRKVPASITGSGKDFDICFVVVDVVDVVDVDAVCCCCCCCCYCCCCCCCFTCLSQTHFEFLKFLLQCFLFSILNILQSL